MKRKLVMMALVLTVALSGCGNTAAQETTAQVTEESKAEASETTEAEETKEAEAAEEAADKDAEKAEVEEKETEAADKESVTDKKDADETEGGEAKEADETKSEGAEEENKEEENKEEETADKKNESDKEAGDKEEADDKKVAEDKKEAEEEVKVPQLSDYTITALPEAKVMYASNPVNVRKGPTTDFERVGGLNRGQEVSVTGQADTGWYEIVLGEEKAFVSDHYLQNEKPADPAPAPQAANGAVTEVKNVAGVIMVGDSRFVQMQENVGPNSCTWIAENGKGYNWLNETAMARIDGCVGKGSKVLINLGVNDPEYVNKYCELVNAKAAEWVGRGAKVYYASVNPVWENPYTTEDEVHYFNTQMQNGLSANVHWIDSHTYLESIGFKLVDGLHYNSETYQNIFAYYMSCL